MQDTFKELEELERQFNELSQKVKSMTPAQLSSFEFVELNILRTELFAQITRIRREKWTLQSEQEV